MPCGERCKIILDGGAALTQSVSCMGNSLTHVATGPPPAELQADFMTKADAAAQAAQAIARWCHTAATPAPP